MLSGGDSTDVAAPAAAERVARVDDADAWLTALRGEGAARERAVAELHELLLRAARFTVRRASEQRAHLLDGAGGRGGR